MPDSKKSTIVIASVLKPIDDSRMYEKIGISLASTGAYQVHIIGRESAAIQNSKVIQHPIKTFRRVSLGRVIAPWRIMLKTLRLKPDVLIIATHELLCLALFMKFVQKCRIIYDVQENYYWNILYTAAFPQLIKPFIALYVRGKENMTARYVDHFFLAEKGYEQELKFVNKKYTILENKVRIDDTSAKTPVPLKSKTKINLIFSGTLAENTGVFTAIDVAAKLHVIDERFSFTIIGFCSQQSVLDKLRLALKPRPFIELITSESPVPHSEIFKHIKKADFGFITYQVNPSTMNSIPTKLYEYLGFNLPILLVNHKPWVDFCHPYSAAIVFDPGHFDAGHIYREMMEKTFYTAEPTSVYWETEETKLLEVVRNLIVDRGL
jgi:glycosyltransferase involved in cell wall biosynthesis